MLDDFENKIIKKQVCVFCCKSSCYVCPRCGINYCSLLCYKDKKHEQCTESFYRDCCLESMYGSYSTEKQKSSMLSILKRELKANSEDPMLNNLGNTETNNDTSNSEDDEEKHLKSRFADLNLESNGLDPDIIWSRLTTKEKREFHRLIETNGISNYITTWVPWWCWDKQSFVSELNEEKKFFDQLNVVPSKSLHELLPSGKDPHLSVCFALLDAILGYTFMMRYFNGDYTQLVEEAVDNLLSLVHSFNPKVESHAQLTSTSHSQLSRTKIISTNENVRVLFRNVSDVVGSIHQCLLQANLPCDPRQMILLLEDAMRILEKIEFCLFALADMQKLILSFKQQLRSSKMKISKKWKTKISFCDRKLTFLHACLDQENDVARRWQANILPLLRKQISVEICCRINDSHISSNVKISKPSNGPSWHHMTSDQQTHGESDTITSKKLIEVFSE